MSTWSSSPDFSRRWTNRWCADSSSRFTSWSKPPVLGIWRSRAGCVGWGSWPWSRTLHIRKGSDGSVCILLYVDDLVITRHGLAKIGQVKSQLSDAFKMKDLHYFLGIEVIHTPDDIILSQRHYVLNILSKFGMTDCQPVSTPLDWNLKLRPDSKWAYDEKWFRQSIRSLICFICKRIVYYYYANL